MDSTSQTESIKILCMDGGGLGGLITARLLQSISHTMPDFLKDLTLIAGTSAGAVNALILAQYDNPVDGLEACIRLWKEPKLLRNTLWGTLLALGGLGPFISADNYQSILQRYIDDQLTLGKMKKHVLTTAFDMRGAAGHRQSRDWHPTLFKSWVEDDGRLSALDVALRASAAPILQAMQQGYIDGGVFNASPDISALSELPSLHRHIKPEAEMRDLSKAPILVLSVGTGSWVESLKVKSTGHTNWGFLQWMVPSLPYKFSTLGSLLLAAQESIVDRNLTNLQQLWPTMQYHRLNSILNYDLLVYNCAALNPALRPIVVKQLEAAVETCETKAEIKATIGWLSNHRWAGTSPDASTVAAPDDETH